jgi:ABC-type Zn uptake system ZnuABC Zn-binding protein ZnuA
MKKTSLRLLTGLALVVLLAACQSSPASTPPQTGKLRVVASTSIIADVVRIVGGEAIELAVLIPTGSDPHTFEPRPQDIAALSDADIVFMNGLGLEEALEPALEANLTGARVEVSQAVDALPFQDEHAGSDEQHAVGDPHTWMDPNNVIAWTQSIASALSQADPTNAATYQSNADAYTTELRQLDSWIRQQVEQLPTSQRKLVTDHAVFAYFAEQYGFEQVGLIVPALSTNAAPSAKELAELEDKIRSLGIPAIFVGTTVNPALSEQVANDTGAKLVFVHTGSLGETGSEVDSYLKFMRFNVSAIVEALK